MKVKQQALDELKRKITALENKKADIQKTIENLQAQLQAELEAASNMPEMTHLFADFSTHNKKRQEQLRVMQERTEREIERLSENVRGLFKEIKSYEILYKNWEKKRADKIAKRTQSELDDIALQRYMGQDEANM